MKYLVKVLSAILIAVSTTTLFATTNFVLADSEKREFDKDEIECLALNIYFETRAVSLADAIAVSDVVMNRINSARYPNTVCEVVKQGHKHPSGAMKRHQCQFSWYCDGKSDEPVDSKTWIKSLYIADLALTGKYKDITEGSLWYHADYILPYWAEQLEFVTQIDDHIFYK